MAGTSDGAAAVAERIVRKAGSSGGMVAEGIKETANSIRIKRRQRRKRMISNAKSGIMAAAVTSVFWMLIGRKKIIGSGS